MRIEYLNAYGLGPAIRAMRNPMDSWSKSDSVDDTIGPEDLRLARKLIRGGPEHRKFLRQISVWADIIAPRYWWAEMDTYKVGTTRNSGSTMHRLGTTELTARDFQDGFVMPAVLNRLNRLGREYQKTRSFSIRREMKQLLPEGYLQRATWTANYETILNILKQRRDHRLVEWQYFCRYMLNNLPYLPEFTGEGQEQ